ncbi:hypothetical protein NUW58_g9833 [Xylaria curta]|uniref:Uncharacterized protein n=1 Tax=Xylaria curta TaxID=42375 RepID=A0ACC1MSK5_9PEZI|nr:hypothetical protein NUW58_g9833 [Xylaria curta]
MSNTNMASESRFTSQNKTTQQRISHNTVGLVALSDFRSPASLSASTPDRSLATTPDNASDSAAPAKKKKRKVGAVKLSFGDEDDGEGGDGDVAGIHGSWRG